MTLKVLLTIDTEPSVGGFFEAPDRVRPIIDEPVEGLVNGRSEALGFILDTLAKYRLRGTFFVEALHTRAFPEAAMKRHVDAIAAGGHEIQLHFHPVWRSWTNGVADLVNRQRDDSDRKSRAELADIMGEGAEQIGRWTGTRPVAARVGCFATSAAVLEATADAGLRYTSHICVGYKPPKEPELQLTGGVHDILGVRELPVTCFRDRGAAGRGLRPLSINANSVSETTAILDRMERAGDPVAVIVSHPFDFLKRDNKQFANMRADRLVQKRLAGLCAFLSKNADRFETSGFAATAATLSPRRGPSLAGSALRGTVRAARNFLNDRLG